MNLSITPHATDNAILHTWRTLSSGFAHECSRLAVFVLCIQPRTSFQVTHCCFNILPYS